MKVGNLVTMEHRVYPLKNSWIWIMDHHQNLIDRSLGCSVSTLQKINQMHS